MFCAKCHKFITTGALRLRLSLLKLSSKYWWNLKYFLMCCCSRKIQKYKKKIERMFIYVFSVGWTLMDDLHVKLRNKIIHFMRIWINHIRSFYDVFFSLTPHSPLACNSSCKLLLCRKKTLTSWHTESKMRKSFTYWLRFSVLYARLHIFITISAKK